MGLFNFLAPVVGGIASGIFGNEQADEISDASLEGFRFLRNTPLGSDFIERGGQALDLQSALLGLGGDEEAASAAFDNFLNNIGFDFALDSGSRAITGNRAARGVLNSGRTGKRLTEFGSNLGRQAFNNFFSQLGDVRTAGADAARIVGSAGSQGGIASAVPAAQARAGGIADLFSGLGQAGQLAQKQGLFKRFGNFFG